MEEERKARIFNAKQRTIGIDKDGLEQQIQENQRSQEEVKKMDQAFADRLLVTEQRVQLMEREVQRARKENLMSIQDYRDQMQQKYMRKEWDLNDPLSLRKDRPARMADDDPIVGPASLQKFAGEDLDYGNRFRKQQQQQAMWVVEQMSEKQDQIEQEREMERLFAERQSEIDERRSELEIEEMKSRAAMNYAVRDYNLALSEAKKEQETIRKMEEMEDALEEIKNQISSNTLTENRATTISCIAPHRYIKYHFKGLDPEQVRSIREEQIRQANEKANQKKMEQEEDQNWDLVQEAVRRNLIAGEREVFRRKQEIARQVADEQRRQAEEARKRKEVLYKQVVIGGGDDMVSCDLALYRYMQELWMSRSSRSLELLRARVSS